MSSGFMKLPVWFFQFALGQCQHNQMSRVFTIKKRTYTVCFECGQEFDYSWEQMQTLRTSANDTHETLSAAMHTEITAL